MSQEIINIKDIKDIVEKVPINSLDYFLEDLKSWVILHKNINHACKNISDSCKVEMQDSMKWIDESDTGEHNNVINLIIDNKKNN